MVTHRLTGDEAEHDALHINPDLEPLTLLMSYPDFARLADGAAITQSGRDMPRDAIGEYGCFVLPSGRLRESDAGSGDVVGLRVTSDGLRLEAVAEPTAADDPSLFAQPLPPLGSLVDALGLATDAESLAHRDFDFDRWRFDTEGAYLARQYELNEDETVAVQVAIMLHKQLL